MANLEKYNARRGKVLINHQIQHLQIGINNCTSKHRRKRGVELLNGMWWNQYESKTGSMQ